MRKIYFFFLLLANLLNVTPIKIPTTVKPTTNSVAGIEIAYSLGKKYCKIGFPSSRKGCMKTIMYGNKRYNYVNQIDNLPKVVPKYYNMRRY